MCPLSILDRTGEGLEAENISEKGDESAEVGHEGEEESVAQQVVLKFKINQVK